MKKARINMNLLLLSIGLPMIMMIKTLVEGISEFPPLLSMRRFIIMGKTVAFAVVVAIVVVLVSWLLAYLLYTVFDKPVIIYIVLLVLTIIPSFLHAYLWMNGIQYVFGRFAMSGFIISVLVQVNYFLFFGTLMWYHVFRVISQEYFDVVYLNLEVNKTYMRVLLEISKVPFTFLLQLFILLGMIDYTIPSIFAYNTYPIEIMSVFASSLSLAPALVVSLPMIVLTIFIVGIMTKHKDLSLISSIDSGNIRKPAISNSLKMLSIVVIGFLCLPFIFMVITGLGSDNIVETTLYYIDDYIFTLTSGSLAALCIVSFSYLLNFYTFINYNLKKRTTLIMIILFGIPGTAIGLLVNSFYSELIAILPWMSWVKNSVIPLIHVDVLRFLPIGYLVLSVGFRLIPRSYIEQGIMETKNQVSLIRSGILHLLTPYMLLSGFITLVLSISELSGAIMVLPPGKSTITVTIYNYLHYGSTDVVAVLSLVFILIILTIGSIFYMVVSKQISFKKTLVILLCATSLISFTGCQKEVSSDFEIINKELDVLAMEVYNNQLYVGTTNGLYVLNEDSSLEEVELEVNLGFIHVIYVSDRHGLFVGGMNGLLLLTSESQVYYDDQTLADKRVYSINENNQAEVYIGTFNGLTILDKNLKLIEHDIDLLSPMVNTIDFDGLGNTLIASYNIRGGGLTIIEGNETRFYGEDSQLASINTTSVIVEGSRFFIGGGMYETGGLNRFELIDGSYSLIGSYSEEDGLAGPKVRSLLLVGRELYVGSEYDGFSILKFNNDYSAILNATKFTTKEGLSHNEIKCMIEYQDSIYFGTKAGLSKIDIKNE